MALMTSSLLLFSIVSASATSYYDLAPRGFVLSNLTTCQDLCSVSGSSYYVWNGQQSTCSLVNKPARAAVEAKGFTSGSGESMQLTGVLIVSDIEIIHLHEGDHEQCHHLCLEDSQCQRWIWNQDKDLCFLDAREDLRGVRMKSTKVESLKTGDRDTILMMEDKTAPAKVNRNKPTPKDKKTPKRPTKKPQPSKPHPKKKGTSPAPTATQKPKTNEEVVSAKKKVVLKANRRPPPRPQPKRKTLLESDDEESVVIINMDSNVDASENIET